MPAAPEAGRGGAPRWRQPGAPGSGLPGSTFNRPTDVAWDRAGNIYIADGIGNTNRVAKFDKDGRVHPAMGFDRLGERASSSA